MKEVFNKIGNQRIEAWWSKFRKGGEGWWVKLSKDFRGLGHFSKTTLNKEGLEFCFLACIASGTVFGSRTLEQP